MNFDEQENLSDQRRGKKDKNVPVRIIVSVLILATGIGLAVFLQKTAPVADRAQPQKQARLVDVKTFYPESKPIQVPAHGVVVAARRLKLSSEVSGKIVELNPAFESGACLAAGALACRIEPRDFELEVETREAALRKAQATLQKELGQQQIARTEWDMYQQLQHEAAPKSLEALDLVLRKPELEQARAEVEHARIALEQARLNLQRTEIRLPFDALILEEQIERGSYISAQMEMASVAATDIFWIQASLPVADLAWVDMDTSDEDAQARVIVHLPGSNEKRRGRIVRLLGELTEEGRMAQVLVAVSDPLDLQRPIRERNPLLLGTYLKLELPGKKLEHVFALPSKIVHNGKELWVVTPEGTLEVRRIDVHRRDPDFIYVTTGIEAGEQVVVSNLAYALDGMPVKINRAVAAAAERP